MGQNISWNHQGLLAVKPGEKDQRYPTGKNNLVFKVAASGVKSWVWQGRIGGVPKTLTLGRFPAMGLADAREKARDLVEERDAGELQKKLAGGGSIKPVVADAETGLTCRQAWDMYIADLQTVNADGKARNAPKTIYEKKNFWNLWLDQEIGDSAIGAVTHDDLDDIVEQIRDAGKDASANTLISYTQAFFKWCAREGRRKTKLEDSPARHLVKTASGSRKRVLSDDEIRWLWTALDDENDVWADGYRLALLTGQRKMELFGLTVGEISGASMWADLPGSRTKNGFEHLVPFGPQAWEIIDRRRRVTNNWLFKSLDEDVDGPVSGFSRAHRRIRKRVKALAALEQKEVQDWRLHDLRRTLSTRMNGILDENEQPLIPPSHVEAVLNHVSGTRAGVAGDYNRHTYLAEKRRALRLWEETLAKILSSGKEQIDRIEEDAVA